MTDTRTITLDQLIDFAADEPSEGKVRRFWHALPATPPLDVERLAFQLEGVLLNSLWELWLENRPAAFRKNAYLVLAEDIAHAYQQEEPTHD
jgi:hypothetical protein